jgi:dephospho-CoA kinase
MVRREIEARLSKMDGLVLVEVPLLFESPLPWWADGPSMSALPVRPRGRRNAFRGLDEAEIQRRESFLLREKRKWNAPISLLRMTVT